MLAAASHLKCVCFSVQIEIQSISIYFKHSAAVVVVIADDDVDASMKSSYHSCLLICCLFHSITSTLNIINCRSNKNKTGKLQRNDSDYFPSKIPTMKSIDTTVVVCSCCCCCVYE